MPVIQSPVKTLLVAVAVIELGAGLALMCFPSAAVALLLGSVLDTPAALNLGRVAGAALLALGVACWLARHDARSPAAGGVIAATLVYDIGVIGVLTFAGIGAEAVGIIQWPAVALHTTLALWCIVCLRNGKPGSPKERSPSAR
jgi:Kef-type K+ transport system membrane component KefB